MIPGVLTQISFKKETTWGTSVVPDKSIKVRPSGGIATNNNVKMLNALNATGVKYYDSIMGERKHEGDYAMDLFCDYPGYFMLGALGSVSSVVKGGETIVYQHTLTYSTTKPSFTIEQAFSDNVQRFAGAVVDSFKLQVKTGDTVQFTPKFMAKSQASATKITPAFLNVRPFNFADALVKIGGTTVTEFTDFEMEFKSNIKMIPGLNTNDPVNFVTSGAEVSGKLTMVLDSVSLANWTDYINNTRRSLEFIATGDAIGVSSFNTCDITVPKMVYKASPIKLTDSYSVLEIDFDTVYDTTSSSLISAVLTNTLVNYN